MILVGFILLAAAVVVAVALIVQNTGTIDVSAFNWTWTVHEYWLVVASLAVALVGFIGLAMMSGGARLARRRRLERRELAAQNEQLAAQRSTAAYEAEADRAAAEREAMNRDAAATDASAAPDRSGTYTSAPARRSRWTRARHVQ